MSAAKAIDVFTEEYPPYTHSVVLQDGKTEAGGWCTYLVKEIAKEAKINLQQISVSPWAKAYNETKNRPNCMAYAAMKSPERLDLFYFVGPIIKEGGSGFVRLKDGPSISSVEDAKKYKTSAVASESAYAWLLQQGFQASKNLMPSINYEAGIKNLYERGRLDFIYITLESAQYVAKDLGLNPALLEMAFEYQLDSTPAELYIILKKCPENLELYEKMQHALDSLKASGEYDKLLNAAKSN